MKLLSSFIFIIISSVLFFSCSSPREEEAIVVTAMDYYFEVEDEIPSGWNTFQLKNMGHAEHFFLLNLLPDSITFETYHNEVTKPFEVVFDSLKAGISKSEAGAMLGKLIPSWYFTSVKQMGGTGIIAPGKTAQITIKLEPGTYAMECYIKEEGIFHTALGMIRPVTVKNEDSGLEPPEHNLNITLTNSEIKTEGEIGKDKNTVAVQFNEHPEVGLGNDVHLIRVADTTNIDSVIHWLDWMNIKGLESPAPVEFLGGVQEMPAGYTAYFTVNLDQGEYAWISESGASRGLVKKFNIE